MKNYRIKKITINDDSGVHTYYIALRRVFWFLWWYVDPTDSWCPPETLEEAEATIRRDAATRGRGPWKTTETLRWRKD